MNWIQKQFYALYTSDLPASVSIDGQTYRRVHTFKYDFFAGTGLYEQASSADQSKSASPKQVVIKIYRLRRFFGLTMTWLGKISVHHEARLYKLLQDIDGVPRFAGYVGPTGFAHEFIVGGPLKKGMELPDDFFENFHRLLTTVHQHQVAYVDLNKPENVLLGDDGKPYLLDFQISFAPNNLWPIFRTMLHPILKQFQREDWYHYYKHKRRLRPDQLTPEERVLACRRSIPIRIHRLISKPYFIIRHALMDLLNLKPVE
jgi:hypothetical protein